MSRLLLGLILLFVFSITSCEQQEASSLTGKEKRYVDSLAGAYNVKARVYYKMHCSELRDSLLPIYVDSIYQNRIEAIKKLQRK